MGGGEEVRRYTDAPIHRYISIHRGDRRGWGRWISAYRDKGDSRIPRHIQAQPAGILAYRRISVRAMHRYSPTQGGLAMHRCTDSGESWGRAWSTHACGNQGPVISRPGSAFTPRGGTGMFHSRLVLRNRAQGFLHVLEHLLARMHDNSKSG